jgi:hypothetical protein
VDFAEPSELGGVCGPDRMESALEHYNLGMDPQLPVRDWPGISQDLDNLSKLVHQSCVRPTGWTPGSASGHTYGSDQSTSMSDA